MKIADSAVLVTGANRGLGKALLEEAFSASPINRRHRQPDRNLSCTCKRYLSQEESDNADII